jgi:hypothetical protein
MTRCRHGHGMRCVVRWLATAAAADDVWDICYLRYYYCWTAGLRAQWQDYRALSVIRNKRGARVGWSIIDLSRTPHSVRLQNGQPDKQRKTQVAVGSTTRARSRSPSAPLCASWNSWDRWCWCFRRGEARLMCIFVIICPLELTERKQLHRGKEASRA